MDNINVEGKLSSETSLPQSQQTSDPLVSYRNFVRPKMTDMLSCLKLNIPYTKAHGNYLYYNKTSSEGIKETPVLDFVGGYGANVLGHNNPKLKQTLIDCLNDDLPNLSQGSVRVKAAELAEKLNQLVPAKGKYICNFSNSGTESVEAALKHAYKVRADKILRKFEQISTRLNSTRNFIALENPNLQLPENYENIKDLIAELQEQNRTELTKFDKNPIICAIKGAFHGKTTSSLKVTFNKTLRESYEGMSALKSVFIDLDKPEQLQELVLNNLITFRNIKIEDLKITIEEWNISTVFAFILEVILGEGGILILKDEVLHKLASLHGTLNVPFIVDEIQTGCGRTGTFFAYEQTALRHIEPDYITLSKALGGGLTKIGVTLIHEKEYDPEFGLVHTSTFAEDDTSSAIGLKVIDILTSENGKVMHEAIVKGDMIINKLKALQQKYPSMITDVRGRGLMIGIEFSSLNDHSPFFRYAGGQGFIAMLISSYILNYHNIRIFSPLSTMFKGNPGKRRPAVIRIQPSVFITEEEVDRLVFAFDEVLNIIANNNEYVLLAHLMDKELSPEVCHFPHDVPITYPAQKARTDIQGRVGFIVHITELSYLIDYYLPSFKLYEYNRRELTKWWDKLCRFLDPDLMHRAYITSGEKTIEANLVGVPFLPKYMIKTYAEGQECAETEREKRNHLVDIQDRIQEAVIKARDLGDAQNPVNIVGLGAYNSIVTENSLTLNDNEVPVTTGNAFTTALVYLGICEAVKKQNKKFHNLTASVIGATGNIGSALTYLIGTKVKKIYIIGRDKELSRHKLLKTRHMCLARILDNVRFQVIAGIPVEDITINGFSDTIYQDIIRPILARGELQPEFLWGFYGELLGDKQVSLCNGEILDRLIMEYYKTEDNPFIEIADLSVNKDCDIVAIATNSSNAWLVKPEDVKKGAIVCCASVPSNLSETFKDQTEDFYVFDGGYALLPDNSEIDFIGMPKNGNAYGCLAETLLLGFEGTTKSFARGDITVTQITKTISLAEKFKFKLSKSLLGDDIQRMRT
jgi:acetylornithine/succinyldiaminopimelate/putrescine aminotransferase/predicted amino acid dehydrogenase